MVTTRISTEPSFPYEIWVVSFNKDRWHNVYLESALFKKRNYSLNIYYRTDICFQQKINKYSTGRKFQDIIWPVCRNGQKIRTLAAEMSINSAAEMRNSVFKRWPTARPRRTIAALLNSTGPARSHLVRLHEISSFDCFHKCFELLHSDHWAYWPLMPCKYGSKERSDKLES